MFVIEVFSTNIMDIMMDKSSEKEKYERTADVTLDQLGAVRKNAFRFAQNFKNLTSLIGDDQDIHNYVEGFLLQTSVDRDEQEYFDALCTFENSSYYDKALMHQGILWNYQNHAEYE